MISWCVALRNDNMRKRLFTEAELTFKKALELTLSYEAAEKNAQQLKDPVVAVNKVTPQQPTRGTSPC